MQVRVFHLFYSSDSFLAAIEREPGTAPIKSSNISKELSAQWQSMSPKDQHEQTQDMVKTLQTARDVKRIGVHNTNLTAFHNAHAVVQHIQAEVSVIPPVLDPSDVCSDCEPQSSDRP